jgi:dsRNA-specific ribonuclease
VALATSADYGELVQRLGVKPIPEDLLGQALTHASYLNEADASATSNERLEFLGDSVLGMVIASVLFDHFPDAGEGELTRMRADIVRGTALARVATRLGLGEQLILGRGEESAGGRTRDRNLAGALEALIGAVYEAHGTGPPRPSRGGCCNPSLTRFTARARRSTRKARCSTWCRRAGTNRRPMSRFRRHPARNTGSWWRFALRVAPSDGARGGASVRHSRLPPGKPCWP